MDAMDIIFERRVECRMLGESRRERYQQHVSDRYVRLEKGLDPKIMMAELFGKRDGYCNGKGGSMHIADVDAGMLGANGIVGAGPPLGTGAALTIDQRDEDRIALSFAGDGSVAQGQFFEAANLASTWDLPVVFLVENNRYGEGTPVGEQHNVENLSDTAAAYNIPGVTVDGMDITAVNEAVTEARERARNGDGPTFIEAETYRFHGHFEGDEELYRESAEVEQWRERDQSGSVSALESGSPSPVECGSIGELASRMPAPSGQIPLNRALHRPANGPR